MLGASPRRGFWLSPDSGRGCERGVPPRPQRRHGRGLGAGLSLPGAPAQCAPALCDKIVVPLLLPGESLLESEFQVRSSKHPKTALLACSWRLALGHSAGGWTLLWGPSRPSRQGSRQAQGPGGTRALERGEGCGEKSAREGTPRSKPQREFERHPRRFSKGLGISARRPLVYDPLNLCRAARSE